jgi:hypothetical protein
MGYISEATYRSVLFHGVEAVGVDNVRLNSEGAVILRTDSPRDALF